MAGQATTDANKPITQLNGDVLATLQSFAGTFNAAAAAASATVAGRTINSVPPLRSPRWRRRS